MLLKNGKQFTRCTEQAKRGADDLIEYDFPAEMGSTDQQRKFFLILNILMKCKRKGYTVPTWSEQRNK